LLGILGAVFYYVSERVSPTPLIPTFFGIALILLGLLAMSVKWRMHAMHGAALLGLVGLIAPAVMAVREYGKGPEMSGKKVAEMGLMAGLCGIFVILCIKSFIAARRLRRQQGKPS